MGGSKHEDIVMRYGDLIQFEPIETVVQLRDADQLREAERLVSSYVISDEMADKLTVSLIPNLRLDGFDNKGLLVVGNYGTGKSHLMSVISAIAEHGNLVAQLTNAKIAEAAASIAGKFKVVRAEIGTTKMGLRDILVSVLEEYLEGIGVNYTFPSVYEVANTKPAFEEMMEMFNRHPEYQEHGLLLVVDELLDYLGSRTDQELNLDLSFLREIGEVCKNLRFRFIAGLQEMLFDNERFSFVAGQVRRVKDRFDQVLIAAKDIKFVVAERLLRKTAEQKVKIREHLGRFAKFYGNMNERMDEFVDLFPVHPEYINTFNRVTFVEKREVLRTLSLAMKRRLNQEIPADDPGLISYDQYWGIIKENAAFKTIPEIREVAECSAKLEGIIDAQYQDNKDLARRIIYGLSLHRLSVGDIERAVGMTAEALRDNLCLYDPGIEDMGGDPADDLLGSVETALRLISRTVNGQFISATERDSRGNPSGQFYLDIKKTADFDAQINKRAESLDESELDQAYFKVLTQILGQSDRYYPGTHQAWGYELEWRSHRASRLGYLFFGTPNQRSTAQPPRDFYLFFLPLFAVLPKTAQQEKSDVFFTLSRRDEGFDADLRRYAAALNLESRNSGKAKETLGDKANVALRSLAKWLRENINTAFSVTYRGQTKPLPQWIRGKLVMGGLRDDVRDIVNTAAADCLEAYFAEKTPDYPTFSVAITEDNRKQAALDALKWLRGAVQTQQATAVLDGLKVLDGDRLKPTLSPYANCILELLKAKGQGQVLNRVELIRDEYGVEYMVKYRLELDWVVVLLAVLVYYGDVVLSVPGKKFDANNLDSLVTSSWDELKSFKHIEQPKDFNVPILKAVFDLVGLEPGKAVLVTQMGNEADAIVAQQFQPKVAERVNRLVNARQHLPNLALWGQALIPDEKLRSVYQNTLSETKGFLESLQAFNTPGKLKNLKLEESELQRQRQGIETLRQVDHLIELWTTLREPIAYLSRARHLLPTDHAWVGQVEEFHKRLLVQLIDPEQREAAGFQSRTLQQIAGLKREYIQAYALLHSRSRLGGSEARQKARLVQDERWRSLERLAAIPVLHRRQLEEGRRSLDRLQECTQLTEQDLQASPICPHCQFSPLGEEGLVPMEQRLAAIDGMLDQLLADWTRSLVENLASPVAQESIKLLSREQQQWIEAFVESGELPELTADWIEALREALAGLEKVVLSLDELKAALLAGGSPMTVEEVRRRFGDYLEQRVRGLDVNKARVVLE
jgi:hypothetical protein